MNRINPIIFEIGNYEVRWYGVLIMLGVALGAVWGARLAQKRGLNTDHVWNGLMFAVILGIIGARLYHVFSIPEAARPRPRVGGTGTASTRSTPSRSGKEGSRAWESMAPSPAASWA